ncbi:MAG: hypothetical protein ACI90V_013857, partial [Bacillariaceae sp.]
CILTNTRFLFYFVLLLVCFEALPFPLSVLL